MGKNGGGQRALKQKSSTRPTVSEIREKALH
jgi:hypothetical protein